MSTKFFNIKVSDVRRETKDTVSIAFDIPTDNISDFQFESGQYLALKTTINGEEIRRSYSLSSAPYENEWRVAVKQVPDGKFSTYANHTLKVGDVLESMKPDGMFKVETDAQAAKTYLLVCAGSGITPIISIAKSVLKNEPNSKVVLVYGSKTPEGTIFKSELDALNEQNAQMSLYYTYSKADETGCGKTRINTQLVKDYLNSTGVMKADDVYVCGPEEMIFDIKSGFEGHPDLKGKVHFELFTTPVAKEEVDAEPKVAVNSHVTVIVDDEEFEFEMSSTDGFILDKAQEADADVPFACKGGVCCTCKAKVMEGEVTMDVNYALDEDEVEEGYVLTCQSRPITDKVVVSFDE